MFTAIKQNLNNIVLCPALPRSNRHKNSLYTDNKDSPSIPTDFFKKNRKKLSQPIDLIKKFR
jgi:hypothetical protein